MRKTMSATSSCVAQARYNYVEAEKSCRQDEKFSLFLAASKLYLQAAPTRSGASAPVASSHATFSDTAVALHSQRLIHLAHMQQLERLQNVPARLAADAVQVVRDMLSLETALANIGFKNPNSRSGSMRSPSSEQLLRSTFAFNSDLGESFMVLDPRGQPHHMGASVQDAARHGAPRSAAVTHPGGGDLARDRDQPHHRPVRPTGGSSSGSGAQGPFPPPHQPPPGRDRVDERRRHVRVEIENELNDPMVQSYLTTHASPMARSHFDFDNVTQSTMSTFNKDTIDNEQGVLNLLQTVRRIGDENAQLLLKIESLKHMEERSAVVYRDIENFKEDFTEKFESLKELLTEYAESVVVAKPPPASSAGPSMVTNATTSTLASATAVSPARQPSQDLLSSIIHKELSKAKSAAAAVAAASARTTGAATVPLASSAAMGIAAADKAPEDEAACAQVRQQQLEKMVKALLQRLDKASEEGKKKDDLLEKYLRVINKFQQQRGPGREVGESGEIDVSAMSVASFHEKDRKVPERMPERDRAGGPPSGRERPELPSGMDVAAAVAAKAGGVLSTYRRNPTAELTPSTASAPQVTHPGIPTSPGAPMPPVPVQRTPSGGYRPGVPAAPRTKNSSAMTLEVLQRSAHLRPSTPPKK